MGYQNIRRHRAAWLLPVAALLLATACEDDRASVFAPVGDPSFDFNVSGATANLPSGAISVGGTTATLTLSGLPALSSGTYKVWAMDVDAQNLASSQGAVSTVRELFLRDSLSAGTSGDPVLDPVTALPIQVTDTIPINIDTTATGYAGTNNSAVFAIEFIVGSLADGVSDPTAQHAYFVTVESSAGNTTPSAVQFLWRRVGVGGGGTMTFGNFGGPDLISAASPNDYVFNSVGTGRAGMRATEATADMQQLARPPVGFYYRGWLIDDDNAANDLVVDTLKSAWDPIPAISRVSLFDADVDALLPGVTAVSIRAAQVRNCSGAVSNCQNTLQLPSGTLPFKEFETFQLTLVPKGSGTAIGATILAGTLPDILKK